MYDELRRLAAEKMAQEKPGQTLQATALVHEAYLRLVNVSEAQHWDSRGHFFAAAAEAMRRILTESARRKCTLRAGGGLRRVEAPDLEPAVEGPDPDLIRLTPSTHPTRRQAAGEFPPQTSGLTGLGIPRAELIRAPGAMAS